MNIAKASRIPPLLANNKFVTNCKTKAQLFNTFFSNQCKPVLNTSTLPPFRFNTDNRINSISIQSEKILTLIRGIDSKKAHGPDMISGEMLKLCDESIVLPLKYIYLKGRNFRGRNFRE